MRHDGYAIRDLSFQFSLMVFGIKYYIENASNEPKKLQLYDVYTSEFLRKIEPALLHLAVNFRSMDDDIRADPELRKVFNKNYVPRTMAFDLSSSNPLNLRDVCNKIIHARKFHWHDKNTLHTARLKLLLHTNNDHDLMILEGELSGESWIVGISLIPLAEQFYEYAEVACEFCGS